MRRRLRRRLRLTMQIPWRGSNGGDAAETTRDAASSPGTAWPRRCPRSSLPTELAAMGASGQSRSPWMSFSPPGFPPLAGDASADVCVVGAGIAGITTAYLLGKKGKRVMVTDDGPIGGGMTGRSTAHLMTAIDDRYHEIERLHGEEGARLAAQSHAAAIEAIEAIVAHEQIDCDLARLD